MEQELETTGGAKFAIQDKPLHRSSAAAFRFLNWLISGHVQISYIRQEMHQKQSGVQKPF